MLKMSIGSVGLLNPQRLVAYLSKNATVTWLSVFFIITAVMEYVESCHIHQFIPNGDAWCIRWNWIALIPSAMVWMWAEVKHKYSLQFLAGFMFCCCGPALLGGVVFREYSYFSFWESEILFGGIVLSAISFFGYTAEKLKKLF